MTLTALPILGAQMGSRNGDWNGSNSQSPAVPYLKAGRAYHFRVIWSEIDDGAGHFTWTGTHAQALIDDIQEIDDQLGEEQDDWALVFQVVGCPTAFKANSSYVNSPPGSSYYGSAGLGFFLRKLCYKFANDLGIDVCAIEIWDEPELPLSSSGSAGIPGGFGSSGGAAYGAMVDGAASYLADYYPNVSIVAGALKGLANDTIAEAEECLSFLEDAAEECTPDYWSWHANIDAVDVEKGGLPCAASLWFADKVKEIVGSTDQIISQVNIQDPSGPTAGRHYYRKYWVIFLLNIMNDEVKGPLYNIHHIAWKYWANEGSDGADLIDTSCTTPTTADTVDGDRHTTYVYHAWTGDLTE